MSHLDLSIAPPVRHKVMLGFPYAGWPCMGPGTARAVYHCSKQHQVILRECDGSWGNFNVLLALALNAAKQEQITHFAMLHADISPEEWWLDILLAEMDATGADAISVAVPIKDQRGVTSCGIGDPACNWHPLKRFTMEELYAEKDGTPVLPETFNAEDAGYPGYTLLHNDGCILLDLRKELFHRTNEANELIAYFAFPKRIVRLVNGELLAEGESEDWYFSRMLHELGAKTFITRKVRLQHEGTFSYPNTGPWGVYDEGDEATEEKWRAELDKLGA
jgi:hypothetical protein